MARNNRTSLTQPERAFWSRSFEAAARGAAHPRHRSAAKAAQYCADFADLAVEHLRRRKISWSGQ